jgi:hypothetical protein
MIPDIRIDQKDIEFGHQIFVPAVWVFAISDTIIQHHAKTAVSQKVKKGVSHMQIKACKM